MKEYLNKKVKIHEKSFSHSGSNLIEYTGVITNIIDNEFIELDHKLLISIKFIATIELVG